MSWNSVRYLLPVFGALAIAVFAAAPARADQAAEDFMRGVLAEANDVFTAATQAERFSGIEQLVDRYVDMDRVGMFVLGSYARQITDAQKNEYLPLFRRFATQVYQNALDNYAGQRLEVTGSVDRSARDIIVNTRVIGLAPSDPLAGVTVHWRIYRRPDGEMTVFDAGADQVWLAIEQQSQFRSVIANNGGGTRGIDALIGDLRAKVGG